MLKSQFSRVEWEPTGRRGGGGGVVVKIFAKKFIIEKIFLNLVSKKLFDQK